MVHNGIEYADIQLIAEAYDLLTHVAGLDAPAIAKIFEQWNSGTSTRSRSPRRCSKTDARPVARWWT